MTFLEVALSNKWKNSGSFMKLFLPQRNKIQYKKDKDKMNVEGQGKIIYMGCGVVV